MNNIKIITFCKNVLSVITITVFYSYTRSNLYVYDMS